MIAITRWRQMKIKKRISYAEWITRRKIRVFAPSIHWRLCWGRILTHLYYWCSCNWGHKNGVYERKKWVVNGVLSRATDNAECHDARRSRHIIRACISGIIVSGPVITQINGPFLLHLFAPSIYIYYSCIICICNFEKCACICLSSSCKTMGARTTNRRECKKYISFELDTFSANFVPWFSRLHDFFRANRVHLLCGRLLFHIRVHNSSSTGISGTFDVVKKNPWKL